jgi:transcription antitermination factor NusG
MRPWLAVFTQPRHEKKVADHLRARSIEAFLPTYKTQRRWKNRQTMMLETPLLPGYLFARMNLSERRRALGVPGMVSILGVPGRDGLTVPDIYIATLRTAMALRRIRPHPRAEIGDRVRIISGPMAGISGTLAHVRSEFRVVISIEMIRQCVSIEVSRDEIEAESESAVFAGFGARAERA